MKRLASILVLGLVTLAGWLPEGYAQTMGPRAEFENVSLDTAARRVYYEQRLYRNPLIGLLEMRQDLRDSSAYTYVPLIQGIPVGKYRFGQALDFAPLSAQERQQYHAQHRIGLLTYLFDFRIQPEFVAIFGNFNQPVQSRTSLMLQSQLYLWRGMVLNFGVLFPVVNHLDGRPNIIRPAPFYLNQFLAFEGHHFLSASAGFFQNDRYGLNVQYQRMNLNSRWTYGLEAGLTGTYYYYRWGMYYDDPKELLVQANVAYRILKPDLTLRLSGGQYLAQDRGVRFDLIRQFNQVELGLYATNTRNGSTLGFHFAVPIPPGKIVQRQNVRLRTSEEFRWEYTYTRGYNIGERYRVGYQLDQRLRQYHQNYLNRQYQQLR